MSAKIQNLNSNLNSYLLVSCSLEFEDVEKIAQFLKGKTNVQPRIGIVCGSGLGGLADLIMDSFTIDYSQIPDFPVSTGKSR